MKYRALSKNRSPATVCARQKFPPDWQAIPVTSRDWEEMAQVMRVFSLI